MSKTLLGRRLVKRQFLSHASLLTGLLLLSCLLCPLAQARGSGAASQGSGTGGNKAKKELIEWHQDLDLGQNQAKQEHKLVLVDVYTDWCGWCKKLDRDTYTDLGVAKLVNAEFVAVKVNAEDGGPGQAMAKKYSIRGYPCILVLDPSGNLKGEIYGFRDATEFPKSLNKILESLRNPADLNSQPGH